MKLSLLLVFLLFVSCSTINKSRIDFSKSSLSLIGGTSQDLDWSDRLTFKRFSWIGETVLNYDILFAELDNISPFSGWMEGDRSKIKTCSKFMIGLFYSKPTATYSTTELIAMVKDQGYEAFIIKDFKDNFDAHPNAIDWRLLGHKMVGLCKVDETQNSIRIKIPGFKNHKLM